MSLRVGQPDRDRHQRLLQPVVQVTLDPAALLVGRVDEARARCLDLLQVHPQLGLQLRVLERQPGGGTGGLDELRLLEQ